MTKKTEGYGKQAKRVQNYKLLTDSSVKHLQEQEIWRNGYDININSDIAEENHVGIYYNDKVKKTGVMYSIINPYGKVVQKEFCLTQDEGVIKKVCILMENNEDEINNDLKKEILAILRRNGDARDQDVMGQFEINPNEISHAPEKKYDEFTFLSGNNDAALYSNNTQHNNIDTGHEDARDQDVMGQFEINPKERVIELESNSASSSYQEPEGLLGLTKSESEKDTLNQLEQAVNSIFPVLLSGLTTYQIPAEEILQAISQLTNLSFSAKEAVVKKLTYFFHSDPNSDYIQQAHESSKYFSNRIIKKIIQRITENKKIIDAEKQQVQEYEVSLQAQQTKQKQLEHALEAQKTSVIDLGYFDSSLKLTTKKTRLESFLLYYSEKHPRPDGFLVEDYGTYSKDRIFKSYGFSKELDEKFWDIINQCKTTKAELDELKKQKQFLKPLDKKFERKAIFEKATLYQQWFEYLRLGKFSEARKIQDDYNKKFNRKINFNAVDEFGKSPFYYALIHNNAALMCRLVLNEKITIKNEDSTAVPLHRKDIKQAIDTNNWDAFLDNQIRQAIENSFQEGSQETLDAIFTRYADEGFVQVYLGQESRGRVGDVLKQIRHELEEKKSGVSRTKELEKSEKSKEIVNKTTLLPNNNATLSSNDNQNNNINSKNETHNETHNAAALVSTNHIFKQLENSDIQNKIKENIKETLEKSLDLKDTEIVINAVTKDSNKHSIDHYTVTTVPTIDTSNENSDCVLEPEAEPPQPIMCIYNNKIVVPNTWESGLPSNNTENTNPIKLKAQQYIAIAKITLDTFIATRQKTAQNLFQSKNITIKLGGRDLVLQDLIKMLLSKDENALKFSDDDKEETKQLKEAINTELNEGKNAAIKNVVIPPSSNEVNIVKQKKNTYSDFNIQFFKPRAKSHSESDLKALSNASTVNQHNRANNGGNTP